MPPLTDIKEERVAVARALLKYTQIESLVFAGYTHWDKWKRDTKLSFASKVCRKSAVSLRIKELVTDESIEMSSGEALITAEMLLAKASVMVHKSITPAEFKTSTELYLRLRTDVQRELDSRTVEKDEAEIGSVEFSRRLNAATQVLNAEMRERMGIKDDDDNG